MELDHTVRRARNHDPSRRLRGCRTGRLVVLPSGPAQGLSLYTTRNGGRDWTQTEIPVPEDLDVGAPVSVAFPEDDAGFVAIRREGRGRAGALLRTTDGGATWLQSKLPAPGAIMFRTASEGWLTSAETGELYATRNGGRGWRVVRLPRPTAYKGSAALPGLPTFTDETTGVLPVTLAGTRSAVSFLRSLDAGRTWKVAATVATRRPITTARLVPATVVDSSTWLAALEGGRRFVVVARGGASRARGAALAPVRRLEAAGGGVGFHVRVSGLADRDPVSGLPAPRCPTARRCTERPTAARWPASRRPDLAAT